MSETPFGDAERSSTTRAEHVRYIDRTRNYYAAQGFERPYRWATHERVPFTPLRKPLAESRLALITTANVPSPPGWEPGEPRPLRKRALLPTTAPPALWTDDLSWHKEATHLDDLDSWLPVHRLAGAPRGRAHRLDRRTLPRGCRPSTATVARSRETRPRSSAAAARTAPTSRSSSRSDRSAIRP